MIPAGFDVAVLSWLLTYAIHSTMLLAGAALLGWRLADQHAWLDAIWKAALIGPLVTASLNVGPIAVPLRTNIPATVHQQNRATEPVTPVERLTTAPPVEISAPQAQSVTLENPGSTTSSWPVMPEWPSIAVLMWLSIAGVLLGRYGARLIRLYRSIGSGPSVNVPALLQALDALKESVRDPRPIKLTISDVCGVPLALTGRHIVLPARFLEQLDADQQRAALAHEMAHLIRRDSAWVIVTAVVERVFFFQPLNRLARIRMTESAEFLCDQWAVQHTGSPLALARCLSMVASWASPVTDKWAVGVSAMARSDSAMVRRVTHILNEPAPFARRPHVLWLIIALAVVAVAAPRVTANTNSSDADSAVQVRISDSRRLQAADATTAAAIAEAQADLRVYRPARPADSLDDRWRWALADAGRQGLADFWIAYGFETPVHAENLVMSDSDGNSFVSSGGRLDTSGPSLIDVLRDGGGNIVVLLRYRGTGDNDLTRAAYRSAKLGFDFERAPVFWLGFADESQSFNRVRNLFERARAERLQHLLIDLASMHGNSNVVIPFLTRLVDLSQPSHIRNEAAEGFGHHHDPRSVDILLRVARTDPLSEVRAEAAETIGEVQTPQAIPALTDLVNDSDDAEVRREAAEAFGDQPAGQALPALERVIASNGDDDVLGEAIEALGELEGVNVLNALVEIVNTHARRHAQQEAVETLGDIDDPGALDALARIAQEHPDEEIVSEAIETLTDLAGEALHPQILALAASGKTARVRRDALEAIGDAVSESGNAQLLDRAEQALERAIFDDPDTSVRMEALDALEKLPRERELRVLRQVIDRHPDNRVRREAEDHLRDRRQ
jgi:HEAT repeat protein/beta-lactamase regulating signal transducer with metallopeptidase domain